MFLCAVEKKLHTVYTYVCFISTVAMWEVSRQDLLITGHSISSAVPQSFPWNIIIHSACCFFITYNRDYVIHTHTRETCFYIQSVRTVYSGTKVDFAKAFEFSTEWIWFLQNQLKITWILPRILCHKKPWHTLENQK